jgi:hypothetical protein
VIFAFREKPDRDYPPTRPKSSKFIHRYESPDYHHQTTNAEWAEGWASRFAVTDGRHEFRNMYRKYSRKVLPRSRERFFGEGSVSIKRDAFARHLLLTWKRYKQAALADLLIRLDILEV